MKWTRDYATGETICAVCGERKGERRRCCPTSRWVSFESFCRAIFPGEPTDRIMREFYDDYLHGNHPSLRAYSEAISS